MKEVTGFRDPAVSLTSEQLGLRKKILTQVTEQPSTFNMSFWEYTPQNSGGCACGTTRCLGGWSDFFTYGVVRTTVSDDETENLTGDGIISRSIRNMGLTELEYRGELYEYQDFVPLFFTSDAEALTRLRKLVESPHEELEETAK